MDADFSVDIFAIEVCEELCNGLKGLIGKKSFLTGRDGQMDSWTVDRCVFVIQLSLFSMYYIL